MTGETGKVNPTPKGCITLSKFLPLSLDLSVLAMVSSRGALKVPLSGIPGGLGGEHVTKRPLPPLRTWAGGRKKAEHWNQES